MRSAPAWAACSKTRLDPSTLSSRVASLALRIAKARCTTTSAPWTRPRTLASSVTSPWQYSVLRQPRSPGSNGRRAMPTMCFTERERPSASTIPRPRSPVGPVTATVRPVVAMAGVYSIRYPAVHVGGAAVGRDHVVAGSRSDGHLALVGADPVGARPGVHEVAAEAGVDPVRARRAEDAVGL